jgi:hypothetical protein
MNYSDNERKVYELQKDKAKYDTPEEEYEEHSSKNEKECSKCNKTKKLSDYNTNTSSSDHFDKNGYRLRRPECITCAKEATQGKKLAKKLAKQMGISYEAHPSTNCGICNRPPNKGENLVFDHCHKTNRFRGYLHNSCNRSIGVLGDDIEGLLSALNYLNLTQKVQFVQDKTSGVLSVV